MHISEYPSYTELRDLIESMVIHNNETAWTETIGFSPEGRKIRAVNVTNREIPIEKKEIALVICGRHGDELGTRAVGPYLLEWLFSSEAANLLKHQHIVLVPVANPDGCVEDKFGLPRDRLSEMEERSIIKTARELIPDLVVDVHSVGKKKYDYHWGGLQAVVIDRKANSGEDQFILHDMAGQIIQMVCEQGYHYLLHDVSFYQNLGQRVKVISGTGYNDHFSKACYDSFHSLSFGVEVNHFFYSPDDVGKSGKSIISTLLQLGNQSYPWEYYPGFPNRLLSGDFLASIRARGGSAGERRRSRYEIWENIDGFIKDLAPYRKTPSRHTIVVVCKYSGNQEITRGVTLSFCLPCKAKINKIRVNDEAVMYQVKETPCCRHVFVDLPHLAAVDEKEVWVEF